MRETLLGKTPEELKELALGLGLPAFTGKQIARWMYVRKVCDIDSMTDISKAGREKLKEACEVGLIRPSGCQVSRDGTKKYLFPLGEGDAVEAVMIPDDDRKTLCVSSQAGCRMGCKFCMTGRQGFHGHLTVAGILSQFLSVDEADELTNAVFMGMGEPLDNWSAVSRAIEVLTADWGFAWSPKRITLSTIGVLPEMKKFLDATRCHLAVSLHNPFPDERAAIMPVQKAWPLQDVIDRAVDAGIVVGCFDSDSPNSKRSFYCGTDNYAIGKLPVGIKSLILTSGMSHPGPYMAFVYGHRDFL